MFILTPQGVNPLELVLDRIVEALVTRPKRRTLFLGKSEIKCVVSGRTIEATGQFPSRWSNCRGLMIADVQRLEDTKRLVRLALSDLFPINPIAQDRCGFVNKKIGGDDLDARFCPGLPL